MDITDVQRQTDDVAKNVVSATIDEDNDDDTPRSQATFSFSVPNFSTLNESVLSPSTFVRNLPWKIMIEPVQVGTGTGNERTTKSMGYFLQCYGESESSHWSCQASAELRVRCHNKEKDFSKKISHLFYAKAYDWGFKHYLSWNEVVDTEKGFIKDDSVTFEVKLTADAPRGVYWYSKKHTGYKYINFPIWKIIG